MATTDMASEKPLEQWSSMAFLLGGTFLLVFAVLAGVRGLTGGTTTPPSVAMVIGALGLIAPVVGVVGLYPRVRDSAPRLSLVGVGAEILAAVGPLIALGWAVVSIASGALWAQPPAWLAVVVPSALVLNTIGFSLIAVVSLRVDGLSRAVGLLLLVPPVMWIALLVTATMTNVVAPDFYAYMVISPALLALGYLLRTESVQTDHMESASDSIA